MRRLAQLFFLALFGGLLCAPVVYDKLAPAAGFFLQSDPLLALVSPVAGRVLLFSLVPAGALLIGTLVFGRFFCGYICPLGTLFDLCGGGAAEKTAGLVQVKYGVLLGIVVAAVLGVNLAGFADPLAFFSRLSACVLYPLAVLGVNAGLDLLRPLAEQARLSGLSHAAVAQPVFVWSSLMVCLGLGLFGLNLYSRRAWCRCFCPLGALLGLPGRFGLWKRRVDSRCNSCMRCVQDCPMGAITTDPVVARADACIQCRRCVRVCPREAVSFQAVFAYAAPAQHEPDMTRRGMLLSVGGGLLAAVTCRIDPAGSYAGARLIRPPGAIPEELFVQQCVRCGACLQGCPTNALQPVMLEAGPAGLWTPRLLPRHAPCDQTCVLCGEICPTGAIRALSLEEKRHAKLGTATLDRNRCLVWEQDRLCLICDEQCPYNAIVFQWQDGARRPFVVAAKCNGCGLCEEACPVRGVSAIIVTAQHEIRLLSGSYVDKARQLQLSFTEQPGDDRFLKDDAGAASEGIPQGFLPAEPPIRR
ncbi:MAG: 4Fe-4S dicluster domain-containing protein [Deltaproteobacteria bacterium]|nr:4Fe-4S dicluster domain-containing protein [Deltaproteobacteria bacterium]